MSGVEAFAVQLEEKATLANGVAAASPQEEREDDAKGQQEEQVCFQIQLCQAAANCLLLCKHKAHNTTQVLQVVTPWTVSSEGAIDYAKLINEVRLPELCRLALPSGSIWLHD